MAYLQLAFGVLSLLLTLMGSINKNNPNIQALVNASNKLNQNLNQSVSPVVPQIQYQYRGQDEYYQYYSDSTGRYWSRVDRNGVVQYAQNPNM